MTVLPLTLLAPPAAACSYSCADEPQISPRDGAEVPRDTQIVSLYTGSDSEEPAILLDADGLEVAGALWLDEDADVAALVFQPAALLNAGETYSLVYGRDDTSTRSLTVIDGMADTPKPPVVDDEASATAMVPSCPVVNLVAARFERPDDSAWFEVEASANRRFDDSVIYRTSCFGSVVAAFALFVPLRLRRRLRSAAG